MKYKGYLIMPVKGTPNLLNIAVEGKGGKIPNCLLGGYTSGDIAKKAIDGYLESKDRKDAKEHSQSGDQ